MHEKMIESVELETCKKRLMILDTRTRDTITVSVTGGYTKVAHDKYNLRKQAYKKTHVLIKTIKLRRYRRSWSQNHEHKFFFATNLS